MSFETELAKLQETVTKLESGTLTLSDSIATYKEGLTAVDACNKALEKEKGELKLLQNDFTEIQQED